MAGNIDRRLQLAVLTTSLCRLSNDVVERGALRRDIQGFRDRALARGIDVAVVDDVLLTALAQCIQDARSDSPPAPDIAS